MSSTQEATTAATDRPGERAGVAAGAGWPVVTVVMPVRNEAGFIERSLGAVLNQDYPHDRLEVLVMDGMSEDATRAIIGRLVEGQRRPAVEGAPRPSAGVRVVENPGRAVPTAFNLALAEARGEVVLIVSGHCEIARDYVRRCVEVLRATGADNVGGLQRAVGQGRMGRAIALATSSPFGVGSARFHYDERPGPADTVYLGAYKRETLRRVGGYDEELIRNQDDELNFRILQAGGKIWLDPSIRSTYYCRPDLGRLWRQYFEYGFYKVRVAQKRGGFASWRHVVPAAFVASLVLSLTLALATGQGVLALAVLLPYLAASLGFAAAAAGRDPGAAPLLPLVYLTLHGAYGLGFLWGLLWWEVLVRGPGRGHRPAFVTSIAPAGDGRAEAARLEQVYRGYAADPAVRARWDGGNPGGRRMAAERGRAAQGLLARHGLLPLAGKRVLEVGCGGGSVLAELKSWGASADDLWGVDVLEFRLAEARRRHRGLPLVLGDGAQLPFRDGSFDLVLLFTVLSSVLDLGTARDICREAGRVLGPGGALLWYDVRYPNPRNPNTRAVGRRQLEGLFPGWDRDLQATTLLPPLARALGPLAAGPGYPLLAAIPGLRSHYMGVLRPPSRALGSSAG